MKSSRLVVAVVLVHVLAIGGVVVMQGCQMRQPEVVQPPPPAPVPLPPPQVTPPPLPPLQPAVPVPTAPPPGRVYEVQPGDMLSKIAARFGVSVRDIVELNNIKDPNKIRVGQKLVLPEYAREQPVAPAKPKKPVPEGAQTYTVQAGDTLSKIAARYGTTVSALREANQISGDKIIVGQKLVIPGAKAEKPAEKPAKKPKEEVAPPAPPPAEPAMPAPQTTVVEPPLDYVVQPGDTIDSLAKQFLVRKDQILQLNNLPENAVLQPGQKIKIPIQ